MSFRGEMQIDDSVFVKISDGARQSPGLMKTAVRRNLSRFKSRTLRRFRDEPPPLSPLNYPLRWKSARQRRYVMMKLRQENNLPYQRTHTLSQSWDLELEITAQGGAFYATNDAPYFEYVQGDWQQPFHIDNGWRPASKLVIEAQEELHVVLVETWDTVVDGIVA